MPSTQLNQGRASPVEILTIEAGEKRVAECFRALVLVTSDGSGAPIILGNPTSCPLVIDQRENANSGCTRPIQIIANSWTHLKTSSPPGSVLPPSGSKKSQGGLTKL